MTLRTPVPALFPYTTLFRSLSSSVGVLTAGTGLVIYASRRLESMDNRRMAFLVVRTSAAAGLTMLVLRALHEDRKSTRLTPVTDVSRLPSFAWKKKIYLNRD